MSRLERKCLATSTVVHVLLVLVLLVGPGFLTSRNPTEGMPTLDVIPAKLVDDALAGGGNPNAKPPPPSPVIAHQAVAPTPTPPAVSKPRPQPVTEPPAPEPPPQPTRTRRRPKPEPVRPEADLAPSPTGTEPVSKPRKEKPKRDLNLDKVVTAPSTDAADRERSRREAREREARERQARAAAEAARRLEIANTLQGIRQNLSPGIQVEAPGPGGEAYANYGLAVRSAYDHAWILPGEVTDESLTVQVIATIARDGSVITNKTRILRRSGNAVTDRSVQQAIDRVKSIGPFPPGAKEAEREFIINFNVKAKRSLG